jgi:peroxiredoxin/uncharacterized membrane protein YphA (DoxX/SURF4 family)
MASAVLGARILLAAVFATAGIAKLRDRPGSAAALEGFGVPGRLVPAISFLLPLAELATAVALVPKPSAQWGGVASLVLLLAFTGGIGNAMLRGRAPDCHCFGQLHSEPAGRGTLIRNLALSAVAALVVVEGPGPSVTAWVADRTAAEIVAIAVGIAALVLGAAALSFWRENRDLNDRLSRALDDLAKFPPGLPIGSIAPNFSLKSLSGESVELEQLLARGGHVALVFVSPDCGPCTEIFPEIPRWQRSLGGRLTIVAVSSGTPEQNVSAARDSEIEVLLEEDWEVTRAYRVLATPSTVLIDPDGRIASIPVSGLMIEPLLRVALRRQAGTSPTSAAPAGIA